MLDDRDSLPPCRSGTTLTRSCSYPRLPITPSDLAEQASLRRERQPPVEVSLGMTLATVLGSSYSSAVVCRL